MSFISMTETGLKAAAPLSKMPADIWRFCAGQSRLRETPLPHRRRARARAYSRVEHGVWQPGPIPGVAAHLKILIVTDAWRPQVNGVVRTLEMLGEDLTALGHAVRYATPEGRLTVPMPTYPEIRLALFPARAAGKGDHANSRPTRCISPPKARWGFAARAICIKHGIAFSTSFHTRFAEYVKARFPFVPERWSGAGCAGFTARPPR